MKPDSIRKFDWLYWASVIVGLLGLLLSWDMLTEMTAAELASSGVSADAGDFAMATILGGAAFGLALNAALWFLISVLRIEVVKWVLVAMLAWTLFTFPAGIEMAGGFSLMQVPGVIGTALLAAAIFFLFRPDAKAWFAEKRGRGGD
ncbi:hypothetical protein K3172_02365 [Qipengyuania sp. 6B39]|uniref:hypothetical protein n=1 Tax=Qipengyuania proteolytica TaxID=2867239 RepID=UPI001C89E747|nr:hypothetical protein [Qipengyuania proteolytica]MBX7494697.1 hypothetical protein [Qipengyuania proteolytica]